MFCLDFIQFFFSFVFNQSSISSVPPSSWQGHVSHTGFYSLRKLDGHVPAAVLSTCYNSCSTLLLFLTASLRFHELNEALIEPMMAFVQLDVYLQLLSTCYNSCSILVLFLTACIAVFRYGMRRLWSQWWPLSSWMCTCSPSPPSYPGTPGTSGTARQSPFSASLRK